MILQRYEYKVGFCDSDMKKLWLGYWVVNKGILWRDEMIVNRKKVSMLKIKISELGKIFSDKYIFKSFLIVLYKQK